MRIAVMLRAYDRAGGIGIYSRNIVKHLLKIDQQNHYVLIFNNQEHVDTYQALANVDAVYVPPANPIIWDQLLVPRILQKWKADLVFNTKFSVPLRTSIKKIMVLHGASWFVHPELYSKPDILYVKLSMPIYCKSADFLISNSTLTTNDFIRLLNVSEKKIETIPLASGEEFKPIQETRLLDAIRARYHLPDNFILTVTSYDPRKNFSTLLQAFKLCLKARPVHLVVVGKDCHQYIADHNLSGSSIEKFIHFPGWVDQCDLPSLYSMADAFVFPSVYEEFGIPVVEAMSCGCPVISSNTGAIPGITRGAALLGDPFDHEKLSEHILAILSSNAKAQYFRKQGLKRANDFSWSISAQNTLKVFQRIASTENH